VKEIPIDRSEWWCWISDDPDMTYPHPGEWVADEIYPGDCPLIQRFDWGRPAPSSWVVAYYDADDERVVEEYDNQADAQAAYERARALSRAQVQP
jgi:hypothetical protein